MHHLHRVASDYESNNMTASNLAIVFGPTLLRRNEDTTDMKQVLETTHQARAVELLTIYVEVGYHHGFFVSKCTTTFKFKRQSNICKVYHLIFFVKPS